MAVKENSRRTLKEKNIMVLLFLRLSLSLSERVLQNAVTVFLDHRRLLIETATSFEELVEVIIKAAEIEPTMKRLPDEIELTKRRVNALEFKVIPKLSEARDFIKMRPDEMERDEIVRFKMIGGKTEGKYFFWVFRFLSKIKRFYLYLFGIIFIIRCLDEF